MGLKRYNVDCGRFAIAFFRSAAVTWVSTHGHRKPSIIQVAINWSHQWSLGDFTRHFFIILNPEIESYTIKKINNFILWTTTVTRKMLAAICLSDFSAPICWCKAVASSYPCVSHTSIYSYYILSRNDSKLLFRNHKIASHLIRAYTNEMNNKKAIHSSITHRLRRSLNPTDTFLIARTEWNGGDIKNNIYIEMGQLFYRAQ